jgi:hypothetical protein
MRQLDEVKAQLEQLGQWQAAVTDADATVELYGLEPDEELLAESNAALQKLRADLEQFKFDLVEQDIADGASAEELHRTNRLAWHFMLADELTFDEAMRIAADIAVSCSQAEYETA